MIEFFNLIYSKISSLFANNFSIALDLATGLSVLITCFVYLFNSRDINKKRILEENNQKKLTIISKRENIRLRGLVDFNLEFNSKLEGLFKSYYSEFSQKNQHQELHRYISELREWLLFYAYPKLLIIGSNKQLNYVSECLVDFDRVLGETKIGEEIDLNKLGERLLALKRDLFVDARNLMSDESESSVMIYVDKYFNKRHPGYKRS